MCEGGKVLRGLGFGLLVITLLALSVSLLAPFWIRSNDVSLLDKILPDNMPTLPATILPPLPSSWDDARSALPLLGLTMPNIIDTLFHTQWKHEGLWAKCSANLTCQCFAQNDFAMEKEFPDWHKATQGLYSIGWLLLLVALLIGIFHLCCRCCDECSKISNTIASLDLIAFVLIGVSLCVFGGFSHLERKVGFEGTELTFDWGFLLALASCGVAILSAIFYLVDGCRSVIIVEHDDCETTKMV